MFLGNACFDDFLQHKTIKTFTKYLNIVKFPQSYFCLTLGRLCFLAIFSWCLRFLIISFAINCSIDCSLELRSLTLGEKSPICIFRECCLFGTSFPPSWGSLDEDSGENTFRWPALLFSYILLLFLK